MFKYYLLAGFVLFLDQWSKAEVVKNFVYGEFHEVVPGFFNLTLAYNRGAAFSFLADEGGWQRYFFVALALILSLWFAFEIYKNPRSWLRWGMALLMAGALGNALDRLRLGMVVDFIDWYHRHWHWPTFNIADIAITLGVVCVLWNGWKSREKTDHIG